MTEENKDLLSSIMDQIKETTESISERIKDIADDIFGTKEEGEATGIGKIIQDTRAGIRDLLGLETQEGETFNLNKFITKARNSVREILGMEPLTE